MSEWHRLGAVGLKLSYTHAQTNAVALVGHMFDRIGQLNPRINVFLDLDRDGAIDAAHASVARYAEETQRPLDGMPIAVSADLAVKGLAWTAAQIERRDDSAVEDADIVRRLRAAGALILGTTNMDEARWGHRCDNSWTGRSFNPHGDGLTPGGAAGGAAASVAAGFSLGAVGGDTMGAMRLPAALCGVFAIRPTPRQIPNDGLIPLSPALDSIALAARSIDDLTAMLTAVAPPDLSMAMQRCRFLVLDLDGVDLATEVRAHLDYAISLLPERPATLAMPASLADLRRAATGFVTRELAAVLVSLGEDRCAQLSASLVGTVETALSLSVEDLKDRLELLRLAGHAMRSGLGNSHILITPACPSFAQPQDGSAHEDWTDFVMLPDIGGLPAIVIPAGRTADNLPIGLQLTGPQGSEAMLLAQARMLNDRIRGYAPPISWW